MKYLRALSKRQTWFSIALIFSLLLPATSDAGKTPQVYTLKFPQNACQIKERWKGTSETTVIHIQDAHDNVDAQKNISKIIHYLVGEDSVELVGVEGASSEIAVPEIQKIPSEEGKEIASDLLLEQGILSGMEKSLITTTRPFQLQGVEDANIFRKNFRAFYGTQLKRDDIIKQINQIEAILNELKTPIFNEALKHFNGIVEEWRSDKKEFTEYLFELQNQLTDLGIEIYGTVHYAAFYEALLIRSRVPEMTLKGEIESLEKMISEQSSISENESLKEIGPRLGAFQEATQQGTMSEKDYLEYLKFFSGKLEIDFNTFRNVKEQLKYLQAFSRVDMTAVLRDVDQLTLQVMLRLAKQPEEKELVERLHHIQVLRNLTGLQGLAEEVNYFSQNLDRFRFEYFASFIHTEGAKYKIADAEMGTDTGLDKILQYVQHFYKGAEIRNQVLVENTLKHMQQKGENLSALVAGGYHTEGIVRELKAKGISYVVVTPLIDSLNNKTDYMGKMMGSQMQLAPQLLSTINLLGLSDFTSVVEKQSIRSIVSVLAQLFGLTEEIMSEVTKEKTQETTVALKQWDNNMKAMASKENATDGKARLVALFRALSQMQKGQNLFIVHDSDFNEEFKTSLDLIAKLAPGVIKVQDQLPAEEFYKQTVLLTSHPENYKEFEKFDSNGPITFVFTKEAGEQKDRQGALFQAIVFNLMQVATAKNPTQALSDLWLLQDQVQGKLVFRDIADSAVVSREVLEARKQAEVSQAA